MKIVKVLYVAFSIMYYTVTVTIIVRQAFQDFHSSVFLGTPAMLPDRRPLRVSVLDVNSVK